MARVHFQIDILSSSLPAMPMAEDIPALHRVGRDLIRSFVINVFKTILLGIYFVLVGNTVNLLLRRETRTRASLYICMAVLLMLGLALALWIIDMHMIIVEVQSTVLSDTPGPLDDAYSAALSKVLAMAAIEDVLYAYMTIVGDGIIIWRVYAFWSGGSLRQKLVILFPITLLLGSTASSAMLTYCAARLGTDIVLGAYQDPAFCRQIQTTSYCTALATTAVATLLLSYKTWCAQINNAFGTLPPRTRTQRVMLILIESGILYMLFFLVQVLMSLKSVNKRISSSEIATFSLTMYQFTTSVIVGMYPTIMVIVVNSKYSVLKVHTVEGSVDLSGVISTHSRRTNSAAFVNIRASISTRSSDSPIDLYEMARMEARDAKEESPAAIKV
ncbi:hypothetical protein L227DRAFT_423210 [Lentinus tigrinus ALCF2SS1-6]|uniref:G-protein coupled receptors family 1 profile domain-containing protein n=1 Tax=Lentinus tigrinus ALCF2SS1-6 TaxID=1328759 RepID=A0A5C2RRC8_9APHY|nr:hypothetical protein L227DRAFT_423210 [Lentinus tigrinus ALCF2SS1-6]